MSEPKDRTEAVDGQSRLTDMLSMVFTQAAQGDERSQDFFAGLDKRWVLVLPEVRAFVNDKVSEVDCAQE